MWIVQLALRRPYTFVVMAVLITILGGAAIVSMPVDIFPNIDIPVVNVIWSYKGISPQEMADRITTPSERGLTTTVNDIEHIESQAYNGVSVIKVYFQPGVKIEAAIAQITAFVQTILLVLPPGIYPPAVVQYNASSVPILQLGLSSSTLSEQELFDYGQQFIRTQLATVQGASIPLPYGGKLRQVMVDIDPAALYAKHLSASDISNAINLQNLIIPAGTVKVGDREYLIHLNSSPLLLQEMNDLPVKSVNGSTVYIKDVAQVRDGYAVQTNIVRTNGARGALLTVLKSGGASTLDVVNRVKTALPRIMNGLPPELKVTTLLDQSIFVRAAINGVLREGLTAAFLTGLMILVFLGSWRSTIIVCVSIPLSILTSLIVMKLFGETLNVMTLGGLALAVGILVDDATVEIENIHRNLGMKKPLTRAILDGAQQIAVPAFVSTLAICIVFVPVLLLTGAAKYLFTPLAMAVAFAMLASYLLSRTLVPNMVHYLLGPEVEIYQRGDGATGQGLIWAIHHGFNHRFEQLRHRYLGALTWTLEHRNLFTAVFAIVITASLGLVFLVGEDFFPYVDSGQMRLHVRAPEGTRIEETEQLFAQVEDEIHKIVPPGELTALLDNIGLPAIGINLAFSDSSSIGSGDGEILISLNQEKHRPTLEIERLIRARLNKQFPQMLFFFQPANITNQILNFGLPAPIDIQVVGRNATANFAVAQEIQRRVSLVAGASDVHVHQQMSYPQLDVDVDRVKADQAGLTQRDVANSVLISLSSSGQTAPNQWLNPANGVNYTVAVQTPQYKIDSFDALSHTPITAGGLGNNGTQLLSNLATYKRSTSVGVVNHYNVQPVFDVYANVDLRDLGGVARDVQKIVNDVGKKLPRGSTIDIRGQVRTMNSSFTRLGIGLLFAIVLVYLLMVVNFQSWLDPFIILMALPGALAGILWMLFLTQTTLSVPSLMGAIMSIGVATANSILLVSFANDERMAGKDALEAALSAGFTRIRPVIMTASAMIIGMLPMALGMGEGGEQNSPLGRAVIGGLMVATLSTLFFVPVMYTFLRKKAPLDMDRQIEQEQHEQEGMDHPV
jgi:CzcA family heavy metal efflux pump